MRAIFGILCLALCSGVAGAQEHLSNFDACVNESKQRRTDSIMPDYLSYRCDGATAQKLAARPDECSADARPTLNDIEHKSRQLIDGLYLRMTWRTEVCAGMCETRFYEDSRNPSYLCEVRRHIGDRVARNAAPLRRYTTGRRYADGYPLRRRWVWRPRRTYEPPASYWRRMQETEEEARRMERRIYDEPDRYPPYSRDYYYRDDGYDEP
jgi:hypothetical protein